MTAVQTAARAAAAGAAAAVGSGVLSGCAYVDSDPGAEEAAPGAQTGVTVERVLEATEYVGVAPSRSTPWSPM